MKIPVGNFGYQTAQLATGATRVPAGAFGDASGLITLGDSAGKVGLALMADDRNKRDEQQKHELQLDIAKQRERFHNEEQAQRNQAAESFAGYQVSSHELSTTLGTQLLEGAITRQQAGEQLTTGLEKLKSQYTENMDEKARRALADNFILSEGKTRLSFEEVLRKHARSERAASFNSGIENLQRLATSDPPSAISQARAMFEIEGASLYGAESAGKQLQQFAERVYATHFMERLTGVRNNYQGLNALEKDIAGNSTLDPDKKNILIGRIAGMKETIEARAHRAEQSRLANIQHQISAMDSLILKGFEPTAQQFLAVSQAAKGTPYEQVVNAQVQFANQSAQFRAAPPPTQERFINQFEAQVRANPSPDGIKTLESYRTINRNQVEMLKEDPMSFAAQKRIAEVPPLDFTNAASLSDQLKARATVARGMQQQYGSPLKVLTKEEATVLTDMLKKGPVAQKRQLLGALYTGIGDVNAYKATMQQIAQDDPVLASAGVAEGQRLSTDKGGRLADLMLRGQQILRADRKEDGQPSGGKLLAMPDEDAMRRKFNNYENQAFAGRESTRNVYFQSARSIYAALSVESGDYSGDMNSTRWDAAMKLATGGIEKHNGRSIVMPYGWTSSEFRDGLKSQALTLTASGRLGKEWTAAELMNLPMENIGDGRYAFRVGDGVLVDKAGRAVTVDFNQ